MTTGASVGQCAARSRSGGGSVGVGTPAASLHAFIVPVDIHSQDPGTGFNCYLVLTLAQKRYSTAHVDSSSASGWLGPPVYLVAFIFGHDSPEMEDFHAFWMATNTLSGGCKVLSTFNFLEQKRLCGHNRGWVRSSSCRVILITGAQASNGG